jgi:hypothetical protein
MPDRDWYIESHFGTYHPKEEPIYEDDEDPKRAKCWTCATFGKEIKNEGISRLYKVLIKNDRLLEIRASTFKDFKKALEEKKKYNDRTNETVVFQGYTDGN